MYRLYLDRNVMTNLKGEPRGDFAALAALLAKHRSRFWIPYSSTHLDDLARGYDPANPAKVTYTLLDLEFMRDLTQGACFQSYVGQDAPQPDRRDPLEFFESHYAAQQSGLPDLTSLSQLTSEINLPGFPNVGQLLDSLFELPSIPFPENAPPFLQEWFPNWKEKGTQRAVFEDFMAFVKRATSDPAYSVQIRNIISEGIPALTSKAVSSAQPENAYQRIDQLLAPFLNGQSIFEMMEKGKVTPANAKPPTAESRFIEAYYQLELFNFHPDKLTPKNFLPNILGDATHAFLAGHCDFLVTEDKDLRHKAAAVYSKIRTSTRIFRVAEFVEFIQAELLDYTAQSWSHYLTEAIRLATPISPELAPSNVPLFHIPFPLFDLFNFFENDVLPPNGRVIHFFRVYSTYSYFTLRDEIRDLVNLLHLCLGPDDEGHTTIQLPTEMNAIIADTWSGRQWSVGSYTFQLMTPGGDLRFSVFMPELPQQEEPPPGQGETPGSTGPSASDIAPS
jgi:hypothetical protein